MGRGGDPSVQGNNVPSPVACYCSLLFEFGLAPPFRCPTSKRKSKGEVCGRPVSVLTAHLERLLIRRKFSVIVGNTYPYTHNTWMTDIKLAHANGIDAFALNVGPTPWQKDRVTDAYNAARDSGTGFKMFISLDMTYAHTPIPDH